MVNPVEELVVRLVKVVDDPEATNQDLRDVLKRSAIFIHGQNGYLMATLRTNRLLWMMLGSFAILLFVLMGIHTFEGCGNAG